MKQAINFIWDSLLMLFLVATCVFYVTSSLMIQDARNFHNTVVAKVETSEGSKLIIDELKEEAKEKGFELKIERTNLYETQQYYYVTLTYYYAIPMIGNIKSGTIEGYAR